MVGVLETIMIKILLFPLVVFIQFAFLVSWMVVAAGGFETWNGKTNWVVIFATLAITWLEAVTLHYYFGVL